jgi:hypothetical protein
MLVGFAVNGGGGKVHRELGDTVPYRIAFALADHLREADRFNIPDRWRSNAAAGGDREAIRAEVVRRPA